MERDDHGVFALLSGWMPEDAAQELPSVPLEDAGRGSCAEPLPKHCGVNPPASQVSGSGSPVLVSKMSRTLGNASAAATAPPTTSRTFLTR